jgi:hypothetical protein
MRLFGEMEIIARHSEKKIRNKLEDCGNTVMFNGYLDTHKTDVYKFMNIATKKIMMSRDVIWLNKTHSQHMKITQVDFVSSEVEDEEIADEEEVGDNHVGPPPPITKDDFIEQQMDVPPQHQLSLYHIRKYLLNFAV